MRDQVLALHPPQRVLELHQLDEDVVLGIEPGRGHRRLEVEAEPLLDAAHAGALRQIEEQHEVEHERGGEDGVATQEVDLDLHRVAEPAEDVDVVPALLGIAARGVVVDAHHVVDVAVQHRVEVRLEDGVEHAELGLLLGLEGAGIVEHLAVAVAEDVGGEPAVHAEHARLEAGRDQRLHEGLAGLEILAADRDIAFARQVEQGRDVVGEVGGAVGEGDVRHQRGVGVDLAGSDVGIVLFEALLEGGQRLVHGGGLVVDLGGAAPDHDAAGDAGALAELADVFHQCQRLVVLGAFGLDVGAVQAADVFLFEDGLHGPDGLERLADLVQQERSSTWALRAAS